MAVWEKVCSNQTAGSGKGLPEYLNQMFDKSRSAWDMIDKERHNKPTKRFGLSVAD